VVEGVAEAFAVVPMTHCMEVEGAKLKLRDVYANELGLVGFGVFFVVFCLWNSSEAFKLGCECFGGLKFQCELEGVECFRCRLPQGSAWGNG